MEASREILWNVSHIGNQVVMYLMFAASMVVFTWGLWSRTKLYLAGSSDNTRSGNFLPRLKLIYDYVGKQKKVRQKKTVGRFHNLIVYGFLVLLFTTTMVFIDHDLGIDIYKGKFYLGVTILSDLFGLGVIIGTLMAIHKRYVANPDRLHKTPGDWLMLAMLAALCIQGFLLEGMRIAATDDPWALYSPVGYVVSLFFYPFSDGVIRVFHFITWWIHAINVFVFFALLPYTKFLHIFTSSANLYLQNLGPKGALRSIGDMEAVMEAAMESEDEFSLGSSTIGDLTWKQRLDLDACTSCGRCQEVCPAYNSGKVLSPKWLILDTRDHMLSLQANSNESEAGDKDDEGNLLDRIDRHLLSLFTLGYGNEKIESTARAENELSQSSRLSIGESLDTPLAGGVMEEDVFWSCNTCRACEEVCPVGIEHVDYIVDVRRSMAMMEGKIPTEAQGTLRAIETRGNPFGPSEERANWSDGLDVKILEDGDSVEVLYWVGCVSAFDKRKQSIARSMVKILNASGKSWGMLGNRECCSGDPARRLGEENLYQTQAKSNLGSLGGIEFKKIVSNCPHCFNSLKNEYPQLASFPPEGTEVIHHSHFISSLLKSGELEMEGGIDGDISYHDPCYLGRYNDTYDEPRDILVQIGGGKAPVEMRENRERGKCCGAGGGHFWMDMKVGERVNVQRVEQAAETGAKTIATGCPFCMQMLEDGIKLTDNTLMEVKDISELVAERLV